MTPIFDIKKLIDFLREGHAEKAIPHLEEITRKLPMHVAAHALLAQAYTIEQRYEDAKVAWQNALFLMPNSPSIHKGFSRVLKELAKQKPPPATEPLNQPVQQPESDTPPTDQPVQQPESDTPPTDQPVQQPESDTPPTDQPVQQPESETLLTDQPVQQPESDTLLTDQPVQPTENEITQDQEVDDTPSFLVNPSSHHTVHPEEIEEIVPDRTLEAPNVPLDEADTNELDSGLNDDVQFPDLPVISIPTVSPEIQKELPDDNKDGSVLPVPPILASYVDNIDEWKEDEELDHLIEELESARIIPKPEHEQIEAPPLETDIEDMVSETLARIYEGQNQLGKAASMYDKLAELHPQKAEEFKTKAQDLRARDTDESGEMQEANSDES